MVNSSDQVDITHLNRGKDAIDGNDVNDDAIYHVQEIPLGTRRRMRIVCVGAGYSGLLMSIIASQRMRDQNVDFQVYEINSELGGTWLLNRYPGCQCDSPAHLYAYSFCPNPNWTGLYASAAEIHQYMKHTSEKFACDGFFKYQHKVTSARWYEASCQWHLTVKDLVTGTEVHDTCDMLINASGVLNKAKRPAFKGFESFGGKVMHSAAWDESYEFTGKRVALIGIEAKHVTLFARSSTWITPEARHGGSTDAKEEDPSLLDAENKYSPQVQQLFAADPIALLYHRRHLVDDHIQAFKASRGGRFPQPDTDAACRSNMKARLGNSEKGANIAQNLIPSSFSVGCRRVTPGPGFLEALLRDNVECVWDGIAEVTETGLRGIKGNRHVEVDAIVCGTGFECSHQPPFELVGRGGANLASLWAKGTSSRHPESYFGTAVDGFPNYFMFVGPNSPVSNGGLVQSIQAQGVYIYKCIQKMQTQGIRSMDVKPEAMREYNEHAQAYLRGSVWEGGCSSWYKRGTKDGIVVAIYPGSAFHFVEMMRHPRWEDYKFQYHSGRDEDSNRFTFLGNGFTVREARGGTVGDTQALDFDSFWRLMELPPIYD